MAAASAAALAAACVHRARGGVHRARRAASGARWRCAARRARVRGAVARVARWRCVRRAGRGVRRAAGEGAPPHRPPTLSPRPRPPTWAWAWAWACCASSGPWPRPRRCACRSRSGPSCHSAPSCAAAAIVRLRVGPRVTWALLRHGSPTHCTHCAAHTPVAHAWHTHGACVVGLSRLEDSVAGPGAPELGPEWRHQVHIAAGTHALGTRAIGTHAWRVRHRHGR